MDGLSELLRAIRLTATAYIEAQLSAPWAVETPPRSAIAAALLPSSGSAQGQAFQPGFGAVLAKLSELVFVDAIRAYVEALAQQESWLAGLRDRYVSGALALIYSDPGAPWTLESLAKATGTSRTVLTDHFVRGVGAAPMHYLSQWRLRVAADLLANTDRATKLIAESAGFGSTAAFTRAFKREFGVPPARWRQDQRNARGFATNPDRALTASGAPISL